MASFNLPCQEEMVASFIFLGTTFQNVAGNHIT